MNLFNRINLLVGTAIASIGLGLPAHAGAIFSDFTLDYTGDLNGQAGNGASQFTQGAGGSLSTPPLTFLLPDSVGADLTVQGFRTTVSSIPVRLTRNSVANELHTPSSTPGDHTTHGHTDNRGFSLCSEYNGTSTFGCVGGSSGATAINSGYANPLLRDESVRFSIADEFMFAVQYVSFGDVGPAVRLESLTPDPLDTYSNDNVRIYFGGAEFTDGEQSISFNIRTAALASVDPEHPELGCFADLATPYTSENRVCTVDIYQVVADLALPGATDEEIFNFLQSDYFRFSAEGRDDDWYIRAAQWVVPDIPEPASMTLLGAGLVGMGYMARRRKAA